jgi:hypothetical protein
MCVPSAEKGGKEARTWTIKLTDTQGRASADSSAPVYGSVDAGRIPSAWGRRLLTMSISQMYGLGAYQPLPIPLSEIRGEGTECLADETCLR